MNEFELIDYYFKPQIKRNDVLLGIGDDCALVQPPSNSSLAITTDTSIVNVHFFADTPASDIGFNAAAVNLSDLAAMGAKPAWAMLALTIPNNDDSWLQDFSKGFFELLTHYNMQLIGGDITKGTLAITVQMIGFVDEKLALKRSGANIGDKIYVTGSLGEAAYAVHNKRTIRRHPRIEVGLALRGIASSAIDISDGLLADLGHILKQSNVGAIIESSLIPTNYPEFALNGGDDYELCFTIPPANFAKWEKIQKTLPCKTTYIGIIQENPELIIKDAKSPQKQGFRHF